MTRSILLALALSIGTSGCYGSFALTRKLHAWNGNLGGKWKSEGAFLGLALLQVYTFTALGDILIFNTVEFWSGKNPVNAGALRLEPWGEGVVARDAASGRTVGYARREGEDALVTDSEGRVIARVPPGGPLAARSLP